MSAGVVARLLASIRDTAKDLQERSEQALAKANGVEVLLECQRLLSYLEEGSEED